MTGKSGRAGLDLRARIALVAVVVFVSFVAALAYFSIRYFQRRYEEGFGRQQLLLVSRVAADLDQRVGLAQDTLLAISAAVDPSFMSNPAAGRAFLDQRITLHKLLDSGLCFVSSEGKLVAESPPGAAGGRNDLSGDEVFRAVAGTGRPAISNPYPSPRTGRPTITFAVPVRDASARVIGQLRGAAALDGPSVLGDLATVAIGTGGFFVLINQDRVRLSHPDPIRRLTRMPRSVSAIVDGALDGTFEGVGVSTGTSGVPMLTAVKRLSRADWVLLANIPVAEVRRPFLAALPLYAAAVAAGALVLVLALWNVLRRLTAPLEETIAAVARIAAAPAPGQRVGVHGVGEVARLGETFDALLDVLERRERELRIGEERFRALFQQSPFMMLLAERSGRIVDANEAFLAAAKLAREEVVGLTGEEMGLVTRSDRLSRAAALDAGVSVPAAERTIVLGGTERKVRFSVRRIVLEDRAVFLIVLQDLTEQRRLEAESRGLEEQLQQQQRLESLGVLAGGIAHDFNNLLTPIIANATLAMEELDADQPVRADVEQILEAACRGAELTKRILAFGRRQVLDRKIVDLNAEIRTIEKLLRRVIGEDIELVVECSQEPLPVDADATQLHQTLVNLAVNAREAMPRGGRLGVTVAVTSGGAGDGSKAGANGSPPGREAIISVSDTGCGVDPAVLPRIFEPFFTTKPKDKGTGLGLSTVHGIVQQHGGRIWVESTPGAGTTFRIALPVVRAPVEEREAPPVAGPAGASGRKLRIVLVEDDALVRSLAERVLRGDLHEVVSVGSPAEALSLPDEPRPDLLVSDVVLPGIDGVELLRRLRERWPDLPVLFMSGFPLGHVEIDEAIASGRNFIHKPFAPAELLDRVKRSVAPRFASAPGDA